MPTIKKRQIIALLIFISALVAFLAISLDSVPFEAGSRFLLDSSEQSRSISGSESGLIFLLYRFLQGLLVVLQLLFVLYFVVSLFDKNGRRQLLKNLLLGALLLLILSRLSESQPYEQVEIVETEPPPISESAAVPQETTFTEVEFDPEPRPWLLPLMITGLALVVSTIAFFGINRYRNITAKPQLPFDELAVQAKQTIDEIEAKQLEFSDLIIRCYVEMNQAVKTNLGIRRSQEMTPHEFRDLLVQKGFPNQPVAQLTDLFEQARYARRDHWDQEREIAIHSLNEVIDYCRRQR